jgi:pimeloyl-ACP methyl ester carboxylesterase
MFRIESLLAARLFMAAKLVEDRLYFVSNLSGKLSLYAMNFGGSVPEPLLPPNIAMQNPHLIGGYPFNVFPKLGKILVMLDQDGDENYQPMLVPLAGGFPEPIFDNFFAGTRDHLLECDVENNLFYLSVESRQSGEQSAYRCNLATGEVVKLAGSEYGAHPSANTPDHKRVVIADSYTIGDDVLFLWEESNPAQRLIFGLPLENRKPGQQVPFYGLASISFVAGRNGLLMTSALYDDAFSPVYLDLDHPDELKPVKVGGVVHTGLGEMTGLKHLTGMRFAIEYNIDGASWLYEAELDIDKYQLRIIHVICGQGELANGVLESSSYDKTSDRFVMTFSTATSPTQIYTVAGMQRTEVVHHTHERVLGVDGALLSKGEDASFVSHDGTRISARMYMPAEKLGFQGRRPVVYYVHGGPQSQERPDFAWFSMPLIQFLTLNGFAVFVPNVRGSTGYGLNYTKQVDRDWGGQDRLDHLHAMKLLRKDKRLDTKRAAVVGRSYGGYMTLTLAGRHPELWKASVDMFGPFDLITFLERIPLTWKPYFKIALGDVEVEADRKFLVERSPCTYIDQIGAPMLVIQGKNDPRVVERESHDLVVHLREIGKEVEYLMFENEGHDVLKYENRVRCYNAITDYFKKYLKP